MSLGDSQPFPLNPLSPFGNPPSSVAILNNTAWSYAAIPLIWVFMFFIRAGCLVLFNPIFKWVGEGGQLVTGWQ